MKRSVFVLGVLIFILGLVGNTLAANPFTGQSASGVVRIDKAPREGNPWLRPIVQFSQKYQKVFKEKLTTFAKDMKTKPFGRSFWLFLWFSFLYGIFHALGPGHGKSIAASYFLSRPGKVIHGFLMGNLLTFSHVFSAVVLILVLSMVFKISGLATFDRTSGYLTIASTVLLMGVGIYLIVKAVHEYRHWRFDEDDAASQVPDIKSLVMTSMVTGLVPCPGAAIILSYAIIMGILAQGLMAMVSVALGMGLTTSGIAMLSILSRQAFMSVIQKNMQRFKIIYTAFSCVGAVAIIGLALMLFLSAI